MNPENTMIDPTAAPDGSDQGPGTPIVPIRPRAGACCTCPGACALHPSVNEAERGPIEVQTDTGIAKEDVSMERKVLCMQVIGGINDWMVVFQVVDTKQEFSLQSQVEPNFKPGQTYALTIK